MFNILTHFRRCAALHKNALLQTLALLSAIHILTACAISLQQTPTATPTPAVSPPLVTALRPTSSPTPTPSVATPTAKPYITPDGEWSVYVNDVYGYQLRYPAAATLTERGVESFPTEEQPTGMTADEYLNQLHARYGDKLCVSIHYQLGYVNISAPPNRYGRYAHCGRTGIGDYGVVNKSETVTIEGQTYTAEGWEVIGPAETLAYHNEFFRITLADGTEIEYGALPDEIATYTDYLKMKDTLLQIVISYTKIK